MLLRATLSAFKPMPRGDHCISPDTSGCISQHKYTIRDVWRTLIDHQRHSRAARPKPFFFGKKMYLRRSETSPFKGFPPGGVRSWQGGYPPLPFRTFCLREGLVIRTRGRATRHSKVDILAVILRCLRACGSKNSSQEVSWCLEVLDIWSSNSVHSIWFPLHTILTTRRFPFK